MSAERFHESIDFDPLVLWMDDLHALIDLLQKQNQIVSAKIGKTAYDSPGKLIEAVRGRTIYDLELYTSEPTIELKLSEDENRLFVAGDLTVLGVGLKISKLLHSKEKRPRLLYDLNAPFIFLYTSWPFVFSLDTGMGKIGFVFIFVACCWWVYIVWYRIKKRSTINFLYKFEKKSALKEHIPAMIIAVIAAIVGALVTKLVSK